MRKHTNILMIIIMTNIWSIHSSYGFGNKITHPSVTNTVIQSSVTDDYVKNQLGMVDGMQTQLKYQPDWYQMYIAYRLHRGGYSLGGNERTALEWLKAGSVIEDEDKDVLLDILPSIRPRHHFHDPIHNVGLDNKFDHSNYANLFAWITHIYPGEFDVTGQSAIIWSIQGTAPFKEPSTNAQSWQDARDSFYSALTEHNPIWREYYLAALFLDLGSVLHLIEDMGVPAHTRNDFLFGHYQPPKGFGNAFENWVEKIIKDNNNQSPWSGSEPVVFDKLAKYFDADAYLGNYLNDGVLPPNTWGLSECSNYQFLSTSTMFGCSEIKYQFPHPSKDHLGSDLIVPVVEGRKIYFNGSNYGVAHIARKSYTQYFADEHGIHEEPLDSTNTADDIGVFEDYANITVPRTINYATGLLNYFFRGKLNIEQTDCNNGKIVITITNKSSNSGANQILKGGTFTLYCDDSSGNRTQVTDFTVYRPGTNPAPGNEWNSTTTLLNYNEFTKAVLALPVSQDVNCILVYEGTISSDPNSLDSDDTRQIATGVRKLCSNCYGPPCEECPDGAPQYIKVIVNGYFDYLCEYWGYWPYIHIIAAGMNGVYYLPWSGYTGLGGGCLWSCSFKIPTMIFDGCHDSACSQSRQKEMYDTLTLSIYKSGSQGMLDSILSGYDITGGNEPISWHLQHRYTIKNNTCLDSDSPVTGGIADIFYDSFYFENVTADVIGIGSIEDYTPDLWNAGVIYHIGGIVKINLEDSYAFICLAGHTSSEGDNKPLTGTSWKDYWQKIQTCY
jgi:hypothetical protein